MRPHLERPGLSRTVPGDPPGTRWPGSLRAGNYPGPVPFLVALTTPEWIDATVAIGTGTLAAATFYMARQAREEATATRELVEIAKGQLDVERQHVEAITQPVLRIDPETIGLSQDDDLWLTLDNRGKASAQIETVTMHLPRGSGVEAELVGGHTVAPDGGRLSITLPLSDEQRQVATIGDELVMNFYYTSPGAGQMTAGATIRAEDGRDRWRILRPLG